jgi:hypothetical protein
METSHWNKISKIVLVYIILVVFFDLKYIVYNWMIFLILFQFCNKNNYNTN